MTDKFEKLAAKIDEALDEGNSTALHTLEKEIESIHRESLSNPEKAILEFFNANIASGIRQAAGNKNSLDWEQPYRRKEIYHLRCALNYLGKLTTRDIKTDLRLRILTNLANALDYVGRFTEAIELWDEALGENPEFGMALANKGLALFCYARYASNTNEEHLLLRESHRCHKTSLSTFIEEHAKVEIYKMLAHLNNRDNWETLEIDFPETKKSYSNEEAAYRRWCSENRLCLSPINDITTTQNAIDDTLTLPDIILPIEESTPHTPAVYAIFNQLKQEYTSSRFLVFEALEEKKKKFHFADHGITLYDTLDYRYYRLWIEKIKMAFLSAHAIFDKTAFLMNKYWNLALDPRSIGFNSIWYKNGNRKLGLSKKLSDSGNWPLRGLHWLSQDIYHNNANPHFIEPEAMIIHKIRQHIAHKYLTVHDELYFTTQQSKQTRENQLSLSISDVDLEKYTLKLLKLVRSTLIYTAAAISHEENTKHHEIGDKKLMTMPLSMLDENFRV